jgi:hypothetical protein
MIEHPSGGVVVMGGFSWQQNQTPGVGYSRHLGMYLGIKFYTKV